MECPHCKAGNPAGQRFCGACGHQLEVDCSQCRTANPSHFKFCGQCGASLSEAGAIVIARSGLITRIDSKTSGMLGHKPMEVTGKPFSLFVVRTDLVIFFSHLNELIRSGEKQSFEMALKHKDQGSLYVRVEMSADAAGAGEVETVYIVLTENTDRRLEYAKMQTQQELVGLMVGLVNNISTAGSKHMVYAIQDGLKKVGLFTRADFCCVYAINRASNTLDPVCEWLSSGTPVGDDNIMPGSVTLAKVKETIVKLKQEKTIIVHGRDGLAQTERDELAAWSPIGHTAAVCHLIYSGKIPVGVFVVAKIGAKEEWLPDGVTLIKFFGDYIADRLPMLAENFKDADYLREPLDKVEKSLEKVTPRASDETVREDEPAAPITAAQTAKAEPAVGASSESGRVLSNTTRPMLLEKIAGAPPTEKHTVFPRDDGLVLLTCPQCGLQETVAVSQFQRLGSSLSVKCPCRNQFAAVLEKRRFFRKPVQFDGYFSLGGDLGPIAADGSIWGQMTVTDLSRAGLRFTSEKARLVHRGDLLMVRFNLDNANKSLIHKPARVISVSSQGVGCRFEGDDNYDITLGFYFM